MTALREAAQQALAFTMRDFATMRDFEAARAALHDDLRAALKQEEVASAWLAERKEYWRKEKEKMNLRAALAQQAEPVEPVAWMVYTIDGKSVCVTDNPADFTDEHRVLPLYTAPPQRKPLTEEDILEAVGWERAEMYMKLTPNFPVDEAKQETLKNARAVERAVWEKNHG